MKIRKIETFTICLMLILLSSVPLIISGNTQAASQSKNVDAAIVLDNSGSMDGYSNASSIQTKWENAVDASSNFVENMKDDDRASLFCFGTPDNASYPDSTGPQMKKEYTSTDSSGKTDLKDTIGDMSPGGYTPLFDTIGYSMDYSVARKRDSSLGVVIALTDGKDNENHQFYPSHDYRDWEYSSEAGGYRWGLLNSDQLTFVIGLDIDEYSEYTDQLENVSKTSGGGYYSADDSGDLDNIYDDIQDEIDQQRSDQQDEGLPLTWIILALIGAVTAVVIAVLVTRNKGTPPQSGQQQRQYQQNQPPGQQQGSQQQPPRQQPPKEQPPPRQQQ